MRSLCSIAIVSIVNMRLPIVSKCSLCEVLASMPRLEPPRPNRVKLVLRSKSMFSMVGKVKQSKVEFKVEYLST